MQDLNKNQIVLLTLLISFVTSIATGIMTVSLLQQAPVEITRNINSIVEKTIEKIIPSTILNSNTKEITTIIVKEEDMIVEAINKNLKSIVRIKERDTISDTVSFYGIGFVVGKDGMIATSRRTITPTNIYTGVMSDGKEFTLAPIGIDKKTNFILFKANQTDKTKYDFTPTSFGSVDIKLGQSVISLGGETSNGVSVGRVMSLGMKESGTGTSTVKYIASIDTDVSSKSLVLGSPLFDLSGNVVGVKQYDTTSNIFVPVALLKNEMTILLDK